MVFNIIVAVDDNGGFGKDEGIPWYYKEDFKFFKDVTAHQSCVMGVNTYKEINELAEKHGREELLPGRKCYVISSKLKSLPNAEVVNNLNDIDEHAFVIGGVRLYNDALLEADTVYLTRVNGTYDCDVFFNLEYLYLNFTCVETYPSTHPDLTFTRWARK